MPFPFLYGVHLILECVLKLITWCGVAASHK
uniref:Uncharacterized protein n=1 Tax=Arundo donax TaxID=35708 RepID=A0A0A9A7F7_ARUDO